MTDKAGAHDTNAKIPDYFSFFTNRAAGKGGSEVLTNKIFHEFHDVFSGIGYFEDKYIILIDESSSYHNLKLEEKTSCSPTFSHPFGRYRHSDFFQDHQIKLYDLYNAISQD